jgi:DDE domain
VGSDYRLVKRRVNPGLGFGAFDTAQRTIQGYEAMHMLRKGQPDGLAKGDVLAQRGGCIIFSAGSITCSFEPVSGWNHHNALPVGPGRALPCLRPVTGHRGLRPRPSVFPQ